VDHVLDMGRTATNVLGNAVAATLVANWEGELAQSCQGEIESAA
jgi:Na+/H+-dicarboxylate symporter